MNTGKDYEEIFISPGGKIVSSLEIGKILAFLEYPEKALILDVGTGTGRVARKLLELNNEIVGIDTDFDRLKTAVNKVKTQLTDKEEYYHVVRADAQHLPFRGAIFEEAFSIRTLKYLENPHQGFIEIARILTPRGICVMELSNVFGYEIYHIFLQLFGAENVYTRSMGPTYNLFNVFEVEKTLKKLNLTITKKEGWHKIPTLLLIKATDATLKILYCTESVLQKSLPFFLFSRGILIKAVRTTNNLSGD